MWVVFVGGGWADTSVQSGVPGVGFFDNNAFDFFEADGSGVLGGVTVGYYVAFNNFVFGVEGEAGFIGTDAVGIAPDILDGDLVSAEYGAYGVLAARAGYAIDRLLIYGKGGVAFANIENIGADIDPGGVLDPLYSYVVEDTHTGYAVGGGLEYAFTDNWTVKAEYLYMDFGKFTASDAGGRTYSVENDIHTAKIGVNYKF